MIFECKNLGFHFEMQNDNFIALNEQAKIKFFGMNEQQLRQNLYTFAEAIDNKFTGRFFQMTLDGGRYPTLEDVKQGQNYCRDNVKNHFPELKLISETTIMPNNIKNCVWERPDGSKFSQYYMAKNSFMFCVAGDIKTLHDDLDNLMASVCISVTGESPEDLAREQQQKLMMAVTEEANRLADSGMPIQEAMSKALAKFGINQKK